MGGYSFNPESVSDKVLNFNKVEERGLNFYTHKWKICMFSVSPADIKYDVNFFLKLVVD